MSFRTPDPKVAAHTHGIRFHVSFRVIWCRSAPPDVVPSWASCEQEESRRVHPAPGARFGVRPCAMTVIRGPLRDQSDEDRVVPQDDVADHQVRGFSSCDELLLEALEHVDTDSTLCQPAGDCEHG